MSSAKNKFPEILPVKTAYFLIIRYFGFAVMLLFQSSDVKGAEVTF